MHLSQSSPFLSELGAHMLHYLLNHIRIVDLYMEHLFAKENGTILMHFTWQETASYLFCNMLLFRAICGMKIKHTHSAFAMSGKAGKRGKGIIVRKMVMKSYARSTHMSSSFSSVCKQEPHKIVLCNMPKLLSCGKEWSLLFALQCIDNHSCKRDSKQFSPECNCTVQVAA